MEGGVSPRRLFPCCRRRLYAVLSGAALTSAAEGSRFSHATRLHIICIQPLFCYVQRGSVHSLNFMLCSSTCALEYNFGWVKNYCILHTFEVFNSRNETNALENVLLWNTIQMFKRYTTASRIDDSRFCFYILYFNFQSLINWTPLSL